jgi:Rieske Fe-S protein
LGGGRLISNGPTRRDVVASTIGLFGLVVATDAAGAAKKPDSMPPQPGDRFQITKGPLKGELLRPDLLKAGDAPVTGYPFESASETLRRRNRFNRLLLVKLDPAEMDEPTRAAAADGVLVYSAVCTHRGCTLDSWKGEERHFRCPCHLSEFNALSEGSVRGGPAKTPLAMVPLTLDDEGFVIAAAEFNRKPGVQKK